MTNGEGSESAQQVEHRPLTASHQCAEIVAQSYAKSLGMKVGICHFGLLFGPGDLHWNHTVPGMIRHLLVSSSAPLLVNSQLVCPLLSVDDASYSLMLMAEYINQYDELRGSSFGFALGDVPTGTQLYQMISKLLYKDLSNNELTGPEISRSEKTDAEKLNRQRNLNEIAGHKHLIVPATTPVKVPVFNISKSRKLLKWKPKFTLVEALTRTCQWYQQYLQQTQTNRNTLPFFRMNSVADPVAKSA